MLKLIKITNSPCNVPELEKLNKNGPIKLEVGEALKVVSGKAVRCGSYDRPQFVSLSDATSGQTSITVARVTPDMVFEADYTGIVELAHGNKLPLANMPSGACAALGDPDEEYGVATVIGIDGNKAIVIFE